MELKARPLTSSSGPFLVLVDGCEHFWGRFWTLAMPPRVRLQNLAMLLRSFANHGPVRRCSAYFVRPKGHQPSSQRSFNSWDGRMGHGFSQFVGHFGKTESETYGRHSARPLTCGARCSIHFCNNIPMPEKNSKEKEDMGDVFAWLLFFFILIALLVMIVFQLMCLADLEFDYINPYDSASRINNVILPEFITQGVLCFLFLVTGHWVMSLLCVPYLYYNVRLYLRRQHLVDVTEIFNLLNWEKKQRLFKLGYIILLLFMCLFWMIFNALEEDEHSF
ncbi:protein cornichon4 [Sesamum alatum]|uniref:Protein cornichon4 n=1 Tax=Sesamum alatum TaxID=300844 RepID=A0AAE1YRN6_9LAMI|nr:protein cornichon4 [Sesamum alatum]